MNEFQYFDVDLTNYKFSINDEFQLDNNNIAIIIDRYTINDVIFYVMQEYENQFEMKESELEQIKCIKHSVNNIDLAQKEKLKQQLAAFNNYKIQLGLIVEFNNKIYTISNRKCKMSVYNGNYCIIPYYVLTCKQNTFIVDEDDILSDGRFILK